MPEYRVPRNCSVGLLFRLNFCTKEFGVSDLTRDSQLASGRRGERREGFELCFCMGRCATTLARRDRPTSPSPSAASRADSTVASCMETPMTTIGSIVFVPHVGITLAELDLLKRRGMIFENVLLPAMCCIWVTRVLSSV